MTDTRRGTYSTLLATILCVTDVSCAALSDEASPLRGSVLDEGSNYAPITGANVRVQGSTVTASSAQDGTFGLAVEASLPDPLVLTISAPGYATVTRRLTRADARTNGLHTILRPVDTVSTVTLPSDPNAAAPTVNVTRNGSTTTLAIPGGSMVDPNGTLVAGQVDVSVTFWPANGPIQSAPGPLLAAQPQGPAALLTYGMADIELRQNGQLLQVAPGAALLWQVSVPAAVLQQYAAVTPDGNVLMPSLWYEDTKTGLWTLGVAAADIAFDAPSQTFSGKLPHLTAWNWDGLVPSRSTPGCLRGKVTNRCGAAYTRPFAFTGISFEEITKFIVTPGADGSYCLDLYTDKNAKVTDIHYLNYHVSAANDPNNSNECDPLLSTTLQKSGINAQWLGTDSGQEVSGYCLKSSLDPSCDPTWASCTGIDFTQCTVEDMSVNGPTCAIPSTSFSPTTSCEGGGSGICGTLEDVAISDGTDLGCQPPAAGAPSCPKGRPGEGDACDATWEASKQECCTQKISGGSPLTCADSVCVPQ